MTIQITNNKLLITSSYKIVDNKKYTYVTNGTITKKNIARQLIYPISNF